MGVPVIRGRDCYIEGQGLLTIKAGALLRIVVASGPEVDQAADSKSMALRRNEPVPWMK